MILKIGVMVDMTYKGIDLPTYPEIIDYALKLRGKAQKEFVKAYANNGKYALVNIGYFSGYYGPRKMAKIQKIFNTEHPIFGRCG